MRKLRRTLREVCPFTGTVTYYTVPVKDWRQGRGRRHYPRALSKAQKARKSARRRFEAALHMVADPHDAAMRVSRPEHEDPAWQALRREVLSIGRCQICGRTNCLTVDHIIPLACGGSNHRRNLQCLCWWCNQAKADHLPDNYLDYFRLAA